MISVHCADGDKPSGRSLKSEVRGPAVRDVSVREKIIFPD
jgi:hypothetical protein